MNKKKNKSIVLAIILLFIIIFIMFFAINATDGANPRLPDETSQIVETGEIGTEEDGQDETYDDNEYIDTGYEKIETDETTEQVDNSSDESQLTEDDLAENEFLVNAIIFTYTGTVEDYTISKGVSDADLKLLKDGEQIVCHIEVVGVESHADEIKDVVNNGEEYQDIYGNYFYYVHDNNIKTFVSIKYQKYITIQCDDETIFDELELRTSNLGCC